MSDKLFVRTYRKTDTGVTYGGGDSDFVVTSTNPQTGTAYTLASSDRGQVVTLNNASAITVTVPAGLGPDFTCMLIQLGAGQVTIAAGQAVTLNSYGSSFKMAGQYAIAGVYAVGRDIFVAGGNLSA